MNTTVSLGIAESPSQIKEANGNQVRLDREVDILGLVFTLHESLPVQFHQVSLLSFDGPPGLSGNSGRGGAIVLE